MHLPCDDLVCELIIPPDGLRKQMLLTLVYVESLCHVEDTEIILCILLFCILSSSG